jgi:hypothetical protein
MYSRANSSRPLRQADLARLRQRGVKRHPVTKHTANHPVGADANGGSAVNEHRAVRRVVGDPQELVDRLLGRTLIVDRDVEVLQPRLLHRFLFLFRPVLGRLPEVQHGFDAILFELLEVLDARLAAGAELGRDFEEIPNRLQVPLSGRRRLQECKDDQQCKHGGSFLHELPSAGSLRDELRDRIRERLGTTTTTFTTWE